VRLLGGLLVLAGMGIMVYNVKRTVAQRATELEVAIPQPT
jgi:cbb3-type cytochrome oxidase subunit 1